MKPQNMQEDSPNLRLRDSHQKEWESSKVHPDIIFNNVRSCSGDAAYERLLYALDPSDRRNDGRLRDRFLKDFAHLDHGGWWCNGLDLSTFTEQNLVNQNYASESEWGCFKPDRPRIRDGKPVKYEHPPKTPAGIFALQVGPELFGEFQAKYPTYPLDEPPFPIPAGIQFWQWVIDNPEIPVCITEGAKKAGCLLSHGHAAIGLAGVWNFADDEGALKPEIKALCSPGREFTIVFDQDNRWHVRDKVARAARRLTGLLESEGCLVTILRWKYEEGKGIDDFVAKQKPEELAKLFEERLDFDDYWENHVKPRQMRVPEFFKFLSTEMKGRLAWNELTSRIELDGTPIEMEGSLTFRFLEEFNIDASEKTIINGLTHVAKQNAYHPVRRYLERCAALEPIALDNLADRYFGTSDPFFNTLVKKWLIGAVARIFEPGCKFDEALILHGSQGVMKSTFFATLGGDWFDDSFGSNIESAKGLMTLHRSWIQEWSEFGRVSKKYDFDTIKGFLSRKTDRFVRQYGRESVDHPRMVVMCGSTNEPVFLKDATGDRRFWVISVPTGWKIPISLVAEERDRLWSAAVRAYRSGASRFLSEEEYEIHKGINEQFRDVDEWESIIVKFLETREIQRFSVLRILTECLEFTIDKIDDKSKNRVQRCLQRLGCISLGSRYETEWDNGKRRVWGIPETAGAIEETIHHTSATPNHTSATPNHTSATPNHAPATPVNQEAWQSETHTEIGFQESCHACHASNHKNQQNFPDPPPEDIPAAIDTVHDSDPPDIHALIDREIIRLGWGPDDETAWHHSITIVRSDRI